MASREKLYQIAQLQKFDGSFDLNANLGSCIGVSHSSIEAAARKKSWNLSAFATIMALVYFQTKMNDLKDDWELIADKSKIWLIRNYRAVLDDMYEEAVALMG